MYLELRFLFCVTGSGRRGWCYTRYLFSLEMSAKHMQFFCISTAVFLSSKLHNHYTKLWTIIIFLRPTFENYFEDWIFYFPWSWYLFQFNDALVLQPLGKPNHTCTCECSLTHTHAPILTCVHPATHSWSHTHIQGTTHCKDPEV